MNTKDFWFSASSVKDYQQCGLKFKFGRIDKIEERAEPHSHHRWFGTLVHALIYYSAATITATKNKRGYLDKVYHFRDEIKSLPQKELDILWYERPTDDDQVLLMRDEVKEKPIGKFLPAKIKSLREGLPQEDLEKGWYNEAKKMIKNGIAAIKGIFKIEEFEKKMFFRILGRNFIGYADVIGRDENGKIVFFDFKTTWDKPGAKLQDDFQFFAYALALKDIYKLDYWPKGYYVHLRSGDLIEYELTPEIFARMMARLKNTFSDMEADVFLADYGGNLCQFCDFRLICYESEDKIWRRK